MRSGEPRRDEDDDPAGAAVRGRGIAGVTVVADAGMMSEANLADIEERRLELRDRREAARGAVCDQPVAAGQPRP